MNIDYKSKRPQEIRNYGREPAVVRATSGPITWRQITDGVRQIPGARFGDLERHGELKWEDTEHEVLLVHPGGCGIVFEADGRTYLQGFGISAPEPTVRES